MSSSSSVLNVGNANHFDPAVLYRTPAAAPLSATAATTTTTTAAGPSTRTTSPSVTGTSVLGVCYDGGVMLAADTLGSYGSLARFLSLSRLRAVGERCVVGGGGEYSDFQYIHKLLEDHVITDQFHNDGHTTSARSLHSYLSRVMNHRRNKFDPLWNSVLIAGRDNGESFLGFVDLLGTSFVETAIATGFGSHIALPLMRAAIDALPAGARLSRDAAKELLERCMRVLFYRDARSLNKIQLADISDNGVTITEPYALATEWMFGERVSHAAEGSW